MINPNEENPATPTRQSDELLQRIAQSLELAALVPSLLQQAQQYCGAAAGFYLLLQEPHAVFVNGLDGELLPTTTWFQENLPPIGAELHVGTGLPNPLAHHYAGWLLLPIIRDKDTLAVLGLLFDRTLNLDEGLVTYFQPIAAALHVLTHHAVLDAHYQKLMRNQYEFVRIVSHDLRSPLSAIQGFASMLEAGTVGELNERQMHFVQKILSGVGRMSSLVDNIQDAGRYDPETGFYEMERKPTDLVDMVHKIVQKHLVPAEKQELSLQVKSADDVPIVNVDTTMFERAITNLVDNAIKYTPNGGLIEVGVARENNDLLIRVTDNGFGISPENLQHLFSKHFRIRRQEHRQVKGSGLGLFIVRSVARRHDGDAFVSSVEGQGSTFGIRLPLRGDNLLGGAERT